MYEMDITILRSGSSDSFVQFNTTGEYLASGYSSSIIFLLKSTTASCLSGGCIRGAQGSSNISLIDWICAWVRVNLCSGLANISSIGSVGLGTQDECHQPLYANRLFPFDFGLTEVTKCDENGVTEKRTNVLKLACKYAFARGSGAQYRPPPYSAFHVLLKCQMYATQILVNNQQSETISCCLLTYWALTNMIRMG